MLTELNHIIENHRQNMRHVRQCDSGIAALLELYGECPADHFDANCIACKASVFIRDMREMKEELLNVA
jgi:hypothetical protein